MVSKWLIFILLVFALLCGSTQSSADQKAFDQKHIEVSLRMVGHQVLLHAGDSTSRVMPIQVVGNEYTIQFASEFGFNPETLVLTVRRVMKEADIQTPYILEVVQCQTKEVVYSFEINNAVRRDIVSCASRELPKACYTLNITFSKKSRPEVETSIAESREANATNFLYFSLLAVGLVLVGAGIYWRKNSKATHHSEIVKLGKFRFDMRNSVLIMAEQKTELTGKEAELLQLLHASVNAPVTREDMLHKVWGDEGNYIGRTLDVFISKLRSKLQADPSVKIVNIHGVGYKLVVDE